MAEIASRVPNARRLSAIGSSVRDAIAATCGKAIVTFTLAQIKILQMDANVREEELMFDNDNAQRVPDKPWQTFDNLVSDDPVKVVANPITVSTDVKIALTSMYVGIADLVEHLGSLSQEPSEQLSTSKWREANIVRVMHASSKHMRHLLNTTPLSRELDYVHVFQRQFKSLVSSKIVEDPGSDTIARLFLNFIKVIAWHTAARAYESEHLTLNRTTFFSILASLQSMVADIDVRDVLYLVRLQVETWESSPKKTLKPPPATTRMATAHNTTVKKLAAPLATPTVLRALPTIPEVVTPPRVVVVPELVYDDDLLAEFDD